MAEKRAGKGEAPEDGGRAGVRRREEEQEVGAGRDDAKDSLDALFAKRRRVGDGLTVREDGPGPLVARDAERGEDAPWLGGEGGALGARPEVRRRKEPPSRRFSVLITVKLPDALRAYLKDLTQRAHEAGVVLDVASWEKEAPMPTERLHCMLQANDYHGLLCGMHDSVDEKTMDLAPSLRVVSTISYRVDHVDVRACASRGVQLGNTSTVPDTAADMIVGLMLAAARRVPEAVDSVRQGTFEGWNPLWLCGKDVHGATVGLVGLGDVSETLVRRLRGFECRVVCAPLDGGQRERAGTLGLECLSFDELLRESDFVVPQCALNERTYHLFGADAFGAMRKDAIFVNVVYGPVCDHGALYDALLSGEIGAAAIDVVDPVPFEPTRLRELPNCILVPNLSTATRSARHQILTTALDNLLAGLFGNDRPEGSESWLPRGKFVDLAARLIASGSS